MKIDDAIKLSTAMDAAMTEYSISRSEYFLSEIAQVNPSNDEFWYCLKIGTLQDVAKWSVHLSLHNHKRQHRNFPFL